MFFPWLPFLAGLVVGVLLTGFMIYVAGSGCPLLNSTQQAATPETRELLGSEVAPEESQPEVVVPDTSAQPEAIEQGNDAPSTETPAMTATKVPESNREHEGPIRVQVLNGCGVRGIANNVAPKLRAMGFDVRESGNAKNFKHQVSKIYDRVGKMVNAYLLADSVGIDSAQVGELPDPELYDIDVTLVVGADYMNLNLGMNSQEGEQ